VSSPTESITRREKLFDTLRRRIFQSLLHRNIRRDEADEITQKAMVVVLSKYDDGRPLSEFLTVTFGIVRMLLKERTHGPPLDQEPADGWKLRDGRPDPEAESMDTERRRFLERMITRLEGRCREVMKMRLMDLSRSEIASRLSISPNHAGVLEDRCLQRLRKLMYGPTRKPGEAHA
jgi:RNA polymerase sigma factor (sigma-70 family)